MHPMIIKAVAAERSADMQAHAAAARRAREIRRSRPPQQARRPWPFMRGTRLAGHLTSPLKLERGRGGGIPIRRALRFRIAK